MTDTRSDTKMLSKLMFKLLPVQVLLAAVGAINGIVSTFFATNFVGVDAMGAVGLFGPINLLLQAVSIVMFGGSVIMCGKYMGQNKQDKLLSCYSVNIVFTVLLSILFVIVFVVLGVFDLTGFLASDPVVRKLFNRYLLGQAIGVLPFFIGNQLPAFLSLENKSNRTIVATVVYIVVNLILNFVFVQMMKLEAFGLALASSLGMWAFMGVQAQHFFSGKSHFRFSIKDCDWREGLSILKIGYPGALNQGYQALRGFIINGLLTAFVGSVGISAFASANNILCIFWSFPTGMLAVSRMIISVSIGEEDRQTLTDCFRVMLKRFIPLMCGISLLLTLLAEPLTMIFYRDPSQEVYMLTVWGVRLLPWCLPLAIVSQHFVCYWQASGRHLIVHILSVLDGFVIVCAFTALTIRAWGLNGLYIGNLVNGAVIIIVAIIYGLVVNRRFTFRLDDLLCMPVGFGAADTDRIDITIRDVSEVVAISEAVQEFCKVRGIDDRRALLSGLAMEEMAGNIVEHGFTKDKKKHSVDVRVVHKDDGVIMRLKDDCVPFDPGERQKIAEHSDVTSNIGLKMVFKIASDVEYQSLLGLNVLTIRI
ncbi:Na+-driven multidrug efflux pump [Ruminococcaceae bacterium YRB3002]|nr:Na+-driven multidrug efflux pump [Ruminococcaceae bacterium YRB3002]